jgi:hypothetical protein
MGLFSHGPQQLQPVTVLQPWDTSRWAPAGSRSKLNDREGITGGADCFSEE